MAEFNFYSPIQVRYGDIDAQGHVNNARYLTFIEQARMDYIMRLNMWDGSNFQSLKLIVAEIRISYKAPIIFNQAIYVGVKTTRLGNKSLDIQSDIIDRATESILATTISVMVAYDYPNQCTIAIPEKWREVISSFEGIPARPVPNNTAQQGD